MARLEDLPNELFCEIFIYLPIHDICTVSLLNKRLRWLLFDEIFQRAYRRRVASGQSGTTALITLLFHAMKHDSDNVVEWILAQSDKIDLNRCIPKYRRLGTSYSTETRDITYLQIAILRDAPRVAARLVKHGTDVNSDMGDYPDLTPLYMTLAQCRVSSRRALDNALRIACTYALPRTTHFLLKNMANPDSLGPLNYSALHFAVSKKLPFDRYRSIAFEPWGLMIEKTVRVLLDFNADIELRTATPRIHVCGHNCWRSFGCDSSGQTALQLASSRGLSEAVDLLLDEGADPNAANEGGFRVLYTTLAQGNVSIAIRLLESLAPTVNPIVHEKNGMTALHAACRFAVPEVVLCLLKGGACVNAPDSHGVTPLHEVLGQTSFGAEHDVLKTLDYLDEYGVDPDIDVGARGGSPRKLGEKHPFPEVRVRFIKEIPKECKLRFRAPKPRNEEIRKAPSVEPPKIPKVQSISHVRQVDGSWAPDHVNNLIKNFSVIKNVPDDKPHKPQKPRATQKPKENPLPLKDATKFPGLGTSKRALNDLKGGKKVDEDKNSQGKTQDSLLSGKPNSCRVEPLTSQATGNSAARFWNNLPKRQAPKVDVHGDVAGTASDQGKHRASTKTRSRKTKWKALELK